MDRNCSECFYNDFCIFDRKGDYTLICIKCEEPFSVECDKIVTIKSGSVCGCCKE